MPSEEKIWMLKKKKRNEMAKTSFVAGLLVMVGIALIFMLPMIEMPSPSGLAMGTLVAGDSCTVNGDCSSGYCRYDYDDDKFCADNSTSCVHDGNLYAPDIAFSTLWDGIAYPEDTTLKCRYGHWSSDPLWEKNSSIELKFDGGGTSNPDVFKIYQDSSLKSAKIRIGGAPVYLSLTDRYNGSINNYLSGGIATFEVGGNAKIVSNAYDNSAGGLYLHNFTDGSLYFEDRIAPITGLSQVWPQDVTVGNFEGADKIIWVGHTRVSQYIPFVSVANYTDGSLYSEDTISATWVAPGDSAYLYGVATGEFNGERKIVTAGRSGGAGGNAYLSIWNYTDGSLYNESQILPGDTGTEFYDVAIAEIDGETKIFAAGDHWGYSCIGVYNFTNGILYEENFTFADLSGVGERSAIYGMDIMNVSGEIKIVLAGSAHYGSYNDGKQLFAVYNYDGGTLNKEFSMFGDTSFFNYDVAVADIDGDKLIATTGYNPAAYRMYSSAYEYLEGGANLMYLDHMGPPDGGASASDGRAIAVHEVDGTTYAFTGGYVVNPDISLKTHGIAVYELNGKNPQNVTVDIDNDGTPEFNHTGILNEADGVITIDFTTELESMRSSCTPDGYGDCAFNFTVASDSAGRVFLDMLNISYDTQAKEYMTPMGGGTKLYGINNSAVAYVMDLDNDATVYVEVTYPDSSRRNHSMFLVSSTPFFDTYDSKFTSFQNGTHTARIIVVDSDGYVDVSDPLMNDFIFTANYSISGSLDKTSYGTGEQIMLKPATIWEYEFQLSDGVIPENLFAYETLEELPNVMGIPSSEYYATTDDVNSIQTTDMMTWTTSRATSTNQWDTQVYKVNITQDPSEIKSLRMRWVGAGQIDYDDYFTIIQLMDYDNSFDPWVMLNLKDFVEPAISTISAVVNASSRNFFDGSPDFNSSIFALAQTQKRVGGTSCGIFCLSLYTDYISLALSDVEEDEWAKVTGWTDGISYGYLLLKIQYNSDSTWIDEKIVLDDTEMREISNEYGETLENGAQTVLTDLWNDEDTDTSSLTHGDGTYRIYMAITDEENVPLIDIDGGVMLITQEFTVDVNLPDGSVCYTDNMCASGICINGFCPLPEESGSATSIPGVLPTAEDPPETDAVEGVSDDTVGLPVWTAITLKGKGVVLNVFVGTEGEVIAEVTDNEGAPLENVEVALVTSTGAVVTARTNKVGRATIYNFPGDPLTVNIEVGGVEIATKQVESGSDDLAYTAAQEIQAAALSSKMGTWAAVLMVVLILPAVAFYLFAKKR
ncbi:carboxypeptidase-like regulatory domain-containing protein [Candidatus Undinarchaeota archaeon]